jgi:glycosyltransferase involved in cell wall biosynthesis
MQKNLPRISVVLPTRNRARLVGRSIASVLAQSYAGLELIVVDDASSDDTTAVLTSIDDPRLKVLKLSQPRGAAAARNHGISAAHAPLLAFVDSDDVWRPDKLERQMAAMSAAAPGTGLCVCSMEVFRGGKRHVVAYQDERLESAAALDRLASGVGVGTPCWLVPRETMRAAGGFKPDLPRLQDYECALRLARTAPVLFMSDILVTAEIGADSISANADGYARAIEMITHDHGELFEDHPAGHSYLVFRAGKYFAAEGRQRDAIRWFMRALRVRPSNVRALAGILLSATGLFPLLNRIRYQR